MSLKNVSVVESETRSDSAGSDSVVRSVSASGLNILPSGYSQNRRRLLSRRRGATMAETAIVIPVLVLLVFGILQWGYIFASFITLRNACAIAARFFTLSTPTPTVGQVQAQAQAAIQPLLNPANLAAAPQVTNCIPVPGDPPARCVQMSYNLPLFVSFVVPHSVGGVLQLNAQATMR